MRKLFFLVILSSSVHVATAQDYILKNWTDHFSIMKNGQGISITGDDIKDSKGVYFLKGVPNGFLQKNTNYWTVGGHFFVTFNDATGKISTDSSFEYNPNGGTLKAKIMY